jgi:hypothetical protein
VGQALVQQSLGANTSCTWQGQEATNATRSTRTEQLDQKGGWGIHCGFQESVWKLLGLCSWFELGVWQV